MKSSLTEYIISIFELFEAEVSSFKNGIKRLILSIILLCLAAFMLFAASLFMILAIYKFYLTLMAAMLASLATAVTLIAIALLLIGYVKWRG